jgi:exopolyphosphatase / guanosine-5'-triphosphate,3'-diphosphate pyrophosphatase
MSNLTRKASARHTRRVSELVALLELGSNATRCLLARITPGVGFRVLAEERVQTRLGDGPPGALSREAVDATADTVHRFLSRVRNGNDEPPRVIGVATSAVRDAENRDRLLARLRRRDGVEVQVLSPGQEARLGVSAARWSLTFQSGLVADLGGSSLQLTRLRRGEVVATASLPLGSVRATRRFFHHDPPKPKELRAFRRAVGEALLDGLPPARRGESVVGMGGTVRTLARMHLRAHGIRRASRQGLRLRQSDITEIREKLEPLPARRRRRLRGLKPERADVILAGAIVIEELMRLGGYLTMIVCTHGVRDGLLLREAFDGEGEP